MAKTKKKKKQIEAMIGELTRPLKVCKIDAGTQLSKFLEDNGYKFSAQVRVNAESEKAGYKLKSGDIVTIIGEVSGGC